MNQATPAPAELLGVLNEQIELLTRLETVLHQENAALRSQDPQAIDRTSQEKDRLGNALEQGGTRWQQALDSALATQPEITRKVEEFRSLSRRCREQNRLNGQLIASASNQLSAMLSLLQGGSQEDATYDASGHKAAVYSKNATLSSA